MNRGGCCQLDFHPPLNSVFFDDSLGLIDMAIFDPDQD